MTPLMGFSVVDVETTGLCPGGHDRVIEIAIIRTDASGHVEDEYVTLVNPHRDVGATHIHGITAGDVHEAPSFEHIAGDVITRLAGRVFVAHNVSFDMRFVSAEFDRLGCKLPRLPQLCTMQLSRRADPNIPSRRLDSLCSHFRVPLEDVHSALADCRATATLLETCISRLGGDISILGIKQAQQAPIAWPKFPQGGPTVRRDDARRKAEQRVSFIKGLVRRLPATAKSDEASEEYASLLDRVLEDRRVEEYESEALFALATECSIGREDVIRIHRGYMADLIQVALGDGVITPAERKDLDAVAKLLYVEPSRYEAMLAEARGALPADGEHARYRHRREDVVGKTVCFTGTLSCHVLGSQATRDLAESVARAHGMVVKSGVSKKLDFLVTADPDSMSGKARKARELDVRVLAEAVYWQMVGVDVE